MADKKTPSRWKLVANGSWLAGQEFPVYAEGMVLGRSKACDVTIPGTHLSRRHVEIIPQGNQLLIRDLESANGTFINEERVTGALANTGDILRVDVYTFRIAGPPPTGPQKELPRGAVDATAAQALENILNMKKQEKDYTQTEWVTKPTSVGNRTHNVPSHGTGRGVGFWLAIAFGLVALSALAYYFVF